jgi:hypothetical protein
MVSRTESDKGGSMSVTLVGGGLLTIPIGTHEARSPLILMREACLHVVYGERQLIHVCLRKNIKCSVR